MTRMESTAFTFFPPFSSSSLAGGPSFAKPTAGRRPSFVIYSERVRERAAGRRERDLANSIRLAGPVVDSLASEARVRPLA
jgi:hypothetical protein